MKRNNLLLDIKFKTALLESMSWDEDQLALFYQDFSDLINSDILNHPDRVLKEISEKYSEETSIVVKQIFNEIIIKNNLHNSKEGNQYVN